MGCLSDQRLAEYVEGKLDAAAVDAVESHIDECADCRLAIAEAARGRAPVADPSGFDFDSTMLDAKQRSPSPTPDREPGGAAQSGESALGPGTQVGRYVVRRIVGSGGMGLVYAAYDPKLDREIALKILRPELISLADERLDREAKLMARLAHPNVITIHDVGSIGQQLYVAMELVVGTTLRQRLRELRKKQPGKRQPPWREVLPLFIAAGRGLAAAHREGVVHRDFKPENVLVGDDGRVRVTDFGLACVALPGEPKKNVSLDALQAISTSPLTQTGAVLGTPAYMAPEQLRGGDANALSDQFGFCVALYEGLYGERPFAGKTLAEIEASITRGVIRTPDTRVPAWLRRAVLRGLRATPTDRWPSMDALLDSLGRDPAARRWRFVLFGGALLLIIGAFVVARLQQAERPCRGAANRLAGVWDAPARQAVQKAFAATGVPYAEDAWRSVLQALDVYSQAWVRMHTEACEATHVRGEQSADLLDLRMNCLDRQRRELQALVAVYAQADASVIKRAVSAAPIPANLRVCADTRELLQPVRPPTDPAVRTRIAALEQRLAALRAQHQAGQYKDALQAAGTAAAESATLSYDPIEAEAQLILGDLQQTLGEHAAAESSFYRALWAGEAGKQDRIAAQAWTRLVYIVGFSQERVAESQRLVQHAEAALRRMGGDELERAALERAAGSIAFSQGQYREAQRRFEASRALLEKTLGPDSLELCEVLRRLALVFEPLGDWTQAIELERRVLAILERRFGPEHPESAESRRRLAQHLFYNEYLGESLRLAQHALATFEKSDASDEDHIAAALLGVSEILLAMERGQEALPLTTRALAIRSKRREPGHTEVAEALAAHSTALLQTGQPAQIEQALIEALRVREILQKSLGTEHVKYAWALSDLGHLYAARGDRRKALDSHRDSLRALERSQVTDPWSIEKQRVEVGRAERMLPDLTAALTTLERAVTTLERDDPIAILLGDAYFELAQVLTALHRDPDRAQRLARDALNIYRREPTGRERRITTVERFLGKK